MAESNGKRQHALIRRVVDLPEQIHATVRELRVDCVAFVAETHEARPQCRSDAIDRRLVWLEDTVLKPTGSER